jgi:hypothetical protein
MSLESIGLLAESERLRARARGDQHLSSVPLLALAALLAGGAAVSVTGRPGVGGQVYWLVGAPSALLAVWWWQRRSARRVGVGRPGPGYAVGAAVAAALLLLVFPLLFLFPATAVCAVLLVMGAVRRNAYLAGWGLALGVLAAFAQLGFFANRLHELNLWLHDYSHARSGYFELAQAVSELAVAALALAAGLWALRRERR